MISLNDLKNRIYSDFISSFDNAITPVKKSFFDVLSNTIASVSRLQYIYLENVQKESFLNSCSEERLLNYFSPLNNVTRKTATKSTGIVTFTGVNGSIIPINTKVTHNNIEFTTTSSGTISNNSVDISVESVNAGILNNTLSNIQLFLNIPIAGVDTGLVSLNGITGAIDEETIENLRTRIINKQATNKEIDSINYYKSIINEVNNVKTGFLSERIFGNGTIGITILTKSNNGVPTQNDLDTVQAYLENRKAIPAYVNVTYFLPTIISQAFTILLSVNNTTNQTKIKKIMEDYIYEYQRLNSSFSYLGLSKILLNNGARLVSPAPTDATTISSVQVLDVGVITWQ
jgi:uncharacterized phage protein gp47/JayE